MKDAIFCAQVIGKKIEVDHALSVEVLALERAGKMDVMRYPRHGCFLAYSPMDEERGLMQLAFSTFSRGVLGAIGDALDRYASQQIRAVTQDCRIARILVKRFGFVEKKRQDGDISLIREPQNVLQHE